MQPTSSQPQCKRRMKKMHRNQDSCDGEKEISREAGKQDKQTRNGMALRLHPHKEPRGNNINAVSPHSPRPVRVERSPRHGPRFQFEKRHSKTEERAQSQSERDGVVSQVDGVVASGTKTSIRSGTGPKSLTCVRIETAHMAHVPLAIALWRRGVWTADREVAERAWSGRGCFFVVLISNSGDEGVVFCSIRIETRVEMGSKRAIPRHVTKKKIAHKVILSQLIIRMLARKHG